MCEKGIAEYEEEVSRTKAEKERQRLLLDAVFQKLPAVLHRTGEQMLDLPPELWVSVFSYLSTEEKHAVRCCCRALRKLIDHPYLWRRHIVVLKDLSRYTPGFWDTLRHRKVTRLVVWKFKHKDWWMLAKFLPTLTAVVFKYVGFHKRNNLDLDYLMLFSDLKDLGVRNTALSKPMLGPSLIARLTGRLTHLSICNVSLKCIIAFFKAVSRLSNLQYLLFHHPGEVSPVPCQYLTHMMVQLKKLKHLSWGLRGRPQQPVPGDCLSVPDPRHPGSQYDGPALTTLELEVYHNTILPEVALWSLTSLRSLTVRYRSFPDDVNCRLNSWLSPIKHLESFSIYGINILAKYWTNIPASVTRLTLRVNIILNDLESIAAKIPSLEHLDINNKNESQQGSLCCCIAKLFPQLKTLRIRFHLQGRGLDLLSLHHLRYLERLELMDCSRVRKKYLKRTPCSIPSMQDIANNLRVMSADRITVVNIPSPQRNPLSDCCCVKEGD
ncbi:uncharacterized protein LOC133538154 isoform X2 [Nerophis ophidion]|uniref:uncharacterized protein LOC133537853 isoform X2 n=2 Tax=Nerophis ophidion TaxID=159077 RepID=UPI002AE0753C|nr:uncharacterized protein LOC133537853 isoform X2 [Nerophis ophidion]XP_061735487.1 uncharacterized protein LOC133538154 isoform X2 [Nerophis ophidion]